MKQLAPKSKLQVAAWLETHQDDLSTPYWREEEKERATEATNSGSS